MLPAGRGTQRVGVQLCRQWAIRCNHSRSDPFQHLIQSSTQPRTPFTGLAAAVPKLWKGHGLVSLRSTPRRPLSTLARPRILTAALDRTEGKRSLTSGQASYGGSSHNETHGRQSLRIAVAVGLGLTAVVYLRRPVMTESLQVSPTKPAQIEVTEPVESVSKPTRLGPIGIVKYYIIEPVFTFFRFLHLVLLFGPVIITAPMLFIGKPERKRRGKPIAEDEENWGAIWWYGFLVGQMERAGPSFIKLGQWAASRADLFSASLCDRMSKLHSNGDPHSMRHTRRVISAAFGLDFDDIFEKFDDKPIGCGAIAQVYRATMKPDIRGQNEDDDDNERSTSVAIKVLHPRVRKTVRRDIAIMSIFAKTLNLLPGMEWLSLPEEVEVFGEMMNQQLDLRMEASNLTRFDQNFRARGHQVTFPRPIKLGGDRKESRDVLIEEFEDALPLKHFLRNGGGPYDDRLANIGLDAFLVSHIASQQRGNRS